MQIIIDIPDEFYKNPFNYCCYDFAECIKRGTVLKKHGRLKDIDWIDDNCENHYSDKDGSWCYAWRDIDNAPTIIEANRE